MTAFLIGCGIAIHIFLSVSVSDQYPVLAIIMGLSTAVTVLGAVLLATGIRRVGAIMVIVGSVPFVPIGLIPILGARRVLDQINEEAFQAKREGQKVHG